MEGRTDGLFNVKQEDHASGHWQNFPAGLRLLVVDDDPVCLKLVEQMLRKCSYEVTTCANATMALRLLREKNTEYDLVLSDVYMPDMDGFKLLEVVGLEMDLPVIMMSSNGDTSNVFRGVTHGACDYLIKPVRLEELRNLWQHVVRRRRQHAQEVDSDDQSQERDEDQSRNKRKADAAGFAPDQFRDTGGGLNGGGCLGGMLGGAGLSGSAADELGLGLDGGSNKKARVVWSVEMHQKFVNAVNQLGIDKAVPKKILEIMGVDGLTRENVASHLQKYRLYLKRVSGVQQPSGQPRTAARPSPTPQAQPTQGPMQGPGLPPQQQPLAAEGAEAGLGVSGAGANGEIAATAALANGQQQEPAAVAGGLQSSGAPGGGSDAGAANAMTAAAAAAAATAGAFPVLPPPPQAAPQHPHPAALLTANPMMAAAAGLNPLLGAMGGLGVGPLGVGPINPLNGLPLPGMQPPLGLLPGLACPGGQPPMGPLGPMGLPGLAGLPGGLPGGLSMNPMAAGGFQQMAAANLAMQGMAAGMGQLPALAMNGLMGALPGVTLPSPQHLFPHAAAAPQQQLADVQQQAQVQAGNGHLQQQHHHQPIGPAAPTALSLQQQASLQQLSLQQLQSQQHMSMHSQQQQQQHPQQQQLQQQPSLQRLSLQHTQQQQQQHQHPQHASAHPQVALPQLPQPQQSQQQLSPNLGGGSLPGGGVPMHGVSGAPQHLHLMNMSGAGAHGNGFGAAGAMGRPPLHQQQPTHGPVPNMGMDSNILLDGDEPADIAAVFNEMYGGAGGGGSIPGGGCGGGGAVAAMGAAAVGMQGGVSRGSSGANAVLLAPSMDSGGLMTVGDPNRAVMDDDFFSFLLKG